MKNVVLSAILIPAILLSAVVAHSQTCSGATKLEYESQRTDRGHQYKEVYLRNLNTNRSIRVTIEILEEYKYGPNPLKRSKTNKVLSLAPGQRKHLGIDNWHVEGGYTSWSELTTWKYKIIGCEYLK